MGAQVDTHSALSKRSSARNISAFIVALADAGGSIGEIELIKAGSQRKVRDIVVFAEAETQLDSIIRAMSANPGTRVLEVRQVLELHQKGKIAIRSRCTIDTLATLRRVYTPAGELMPNPLDKKAHRAVARAVAMKAMEQGLTRAEYVEYVE